MAIAPGLKRRGGLFGASVQPPMPPDMTASQQPMAPAKPKFFGEGGVGRSIAGNIGDFLLQYSGMDPIYAPVMQQKQAMAYYQQQREMQRRQGLEDWVWKEEYGRRNPKPAQPHRWERNDGSLMEIDANGEPRVAYEDPTPKMMFITDGVGGGRWVEQPRPRPAPQTLPKDFDGFDGDSPPPVSAAPSRANTVARSAYQAWVNQLGQAEADAMLRRNGLSVGNY